MNVHQANSLPSSGYHVIMYAYTLFRNLDIFSLKVSFSLKNPIFSMLTTFAWNKTGRLYGFSGNALLSLSWSRFGKTYEAVQSLLGLVPRGLWKFWWCWSEFFSKSLVWSLLHWDSFATALNILSGISWTMHCTRRNAFDFVISLQKMEWNCK